jgi:hypothetical protein
MQGPDTAEPLRVTAVVGNTLTVLREVPDNFRREIRAGDQILASLIEPA